MSSVHQQGIPQYPGRRPMTKDERQYWEGYQRTHERRLKITDIMNATSKYTWCKLQAYTLQEIRQVHLEVHNEIP